MFHRYQTFEFCDQPWVGGVFRDAFMDCLENVYRFFSPYSAHFSHLLERARARGKIVDLATGNAAPVRIFLNFLQKRSGSDQNLPVAATDLYPNFTAWELVRKSYPNFSYETRPFNALQEHQGGPCLYTMFTAFHHFDDAQALDLIATKVTDSSELMIFEMTPRDHVISYIYGPVVIPFLMLSSLVVRRWDWRKVLISLIIPIVPVMVVFDGLMSAFRTYTQAELVDLARQASLRTGRNIKADFQAKTYCGFLPTYACRFYAEENQ